MSSDHDRVDVLLDELAAVRVERDSALAEVCDLGVRLDAALHSHSGRWKATRHDGAEMLVCVSCGSELPEDTFAVVEATQ